MKLWTHIIFLGLCAITSTAEARHGVTESLFYYSLSLPMAGTRDFLSSTEFLGFGIEGTRYLNAQFGLGFSAAWLYFAGSDGAFTKTIDAYPIYLRLKYIVSKTESHWEPYIALGVGTIYGQKQSEMGQNLVNQNGWQFATAPEVGFQWHLGQSASALGASARYDAGFGTGDLPALSFLRFSVGISYNL